MKKHVYLADMKDKFYNEMTQLVTRILKKVVSPKLLAKEIEKFGEVQKQKKTLENNMRIKQEIHIKSVMFERDNL